MYDQQSKKKLPSPVDIYGQEAKKLPSPDEVLGAKKKEDELVLPLLQTSSDFSGLRGGTPAPTSLDYWNAGLPQGQQPSDQTQTQPQSDQTTEPVSPSGVALNKINRLKNLSDLTLTDQQKADITNIVRQKPALDITKKDPVREQTLPMEEKIFNLQNEMRAGNINPEQYFTEIGKTQNDIDQIRKSAFTNRSAIDYLQNKVPFDVENVDFKSLESSIDKNNSSDVLAFNKFKKARTIDDALSAPTFEEGGIMYAMAQDPHIAKQVEALGGITDNLPNAFAGKLVEQFLYDPDVIEAVKENPDLIKKWKETEFNLYNHYPALAKQKVAQIISQAREDRGLNSWTGNAPTKETTDKLVDDLVNEGKLGPREKAVYDEQIRPYQGTFRSIGRGIGRVFAPALVNENPIKTPDVLSTTGDAYVNTLRNVATSMEDAAQIFTQGPVGEDQGPGAADRSLFDQTKRLNNLIQHDYTQVSLDPRHWSRELSSATGHITGFVLPMILGGELGKAAGMGQNAAELFTNGMMFEGTNRDNSLKYFPGDTEKQNLYTLIGTAGDMMLGRAIPTKATADAARNILHPEIRRIITAFADKQITGDVARASLLKAAKNVIGSNAHIGGVMAGFDIFHNALDAVTGGRDVSLDESANSAMNAFKSGFLGSTFLNTVKEFGTVRGQVPARAIVEMADNPEYFRQVIEETAKLDPQLEKTKNERILNLNEAAKTIRELDETYLNDADKEKYVVTALKQKVWERKAENTTDDVLKKDYENKAAEFSKQKEAILKPTPAPAEAKAETGQTTAADQLLQKYGPGEAQTTERTPEELATEKGIPGEIGNMLKAGTITPEQGVLEIAKQRQGISDDGSDLGEGRPRDAFQNYDNDLMDAVDKKFPDKQSVIDAIKPKTNAEETQTKAETVPAVGTETTQGAAPATGEAPLPTTTETVLENDKYKVGKEQEAGELKQKIKDLRNSDGSISDENLQEFRDLNKQLSSLQVEAPTPSKIRELVDQANNGDKEAQQYLDENKIKWKPTTTETVPKEAAKPVVKMFERPDMENPVHEVTVGDQKVYIQRQHGMSVSDNAWYEVQKDDKGQWNRVGNTQDPYTGMYAGHVGDTKAEAIDHIVKRGQGAPEVKPAEPEYKGPPETISDAQFNKFTDTGEVDPATLEAISEKVKAHTPLSDRETAIFADRGKEMNDRLVKEQIDQENKQPASFADRLLNWADRVENFDITGSGGSSAVLNLVKVPQALLATTMRIVAYSMKAGKTLAEAIKDGLDHLSAHGFKEADKDGEFTRVVSDVVAGNKPSFNPPDKEPDPVLPPKENPVEVKINTAGPGGYWANWKDLFVGNFYHLGELSEPARQAAVRLANLGGQVSAMIRTTTPKIEKLLGKGGTVLLSKAIVQSRLNGIRDRWQSLSDNVKKIPDADIMQAYKDGLKNLIDVYDNHYPEMGAREQTQAALARGDNDAFRTLTSLYFEDAMNSVQDVDFGSTSYDDVKQMKNFPEALQIYKNNIEKVFAGIHREQEGTFSDALGDLQTYYPMIPFVKNGHVFMKKAREFGNSIEGNHFFASGLSPRGYDTSVENLTKKISQFLRTSDKNNLLDTMSEAGIIKITNKPPPTEERYLDINGEIYKARIRPVSEPREITNKEGKKVAIPGRWAIIPEQLYAELKPLLDTDKEFDNKSSNNVFNWVTNFALASPAEFTLHFANLIGTMVTGTPYVDTNLFAKAASLTPIVGHLAKFLYTASTIWTEKVPDEDLIQMAREGLVSNRYGRVTTSKSFAEAGGKDVELIDWTHNPQKIFSVGLFGPKGVDIKARHRMWRLHKDMFPDNTGEQIVTTKADIANKEADIEKLSGDDKKNAQAELKDLQTDLKTLTTKNAQRNEDRRQFVNQLGNYGWASQGSIERMLKKTGLTPFYTAGSTMWRNGVNAWLSNTPLSRDMSWEKRLAVRAGMNLSSGMLAYLGTWATAYYMVTGKTPDKDKRARLGEIPIPESLKKNSVIKALFYKDGEWHNMGMGFFNPLMTRGSRALGIRGIVNAHQMGGSIGQSIEHGEIDALNSLISPVSSSPEVNFIGTALFGNAAYIHSFRDTYGNFEPQTYQTVEKLPGGRQQLANIAQAALNVNPLFSRVGEASGISFAPKYKKTHENSLAQKTLSNILEIIAPRLLSPPHNTYKEERAMIKEEKLTNKK